MLAWSDKYATGFPLVDAQHQMLIGQINELERMLLHPPLAKEDCDNLVRFMACYIETHFRYEEDCMHRHRCPVQDQNKQAHADLLSIFMQFRERYAAQGPETELLKNFQLTAANWVRDHILRVDLHLRACVAQ
jgi:hemerythrin-like metal-binding protein